MIIKTKEFKEVATSILLAVDESAANLELLVKDGNLRLNVTNKEYYVSKIFPLEQPEDFHAVVSAQLFLNLISGLTTDEFDLSIENNTVVIKVGKKGRYVAPMIYDNDTLIELAPIVIKNTTVSMTVSNDILQSVLNVNSKEVQKAKAINSPELNKLYYFDETGCFTFTASGACLNNFTLEKPIKLALTDRIVRLFRLFKTDVNLFYGIDAGADGSCQTKVVLATADTYLAAIVNCDDIQLSNLQRYCEATKKYATQAYQNHLVISTTELSAAIARLLQFTKNSTPGQDMKMVPASVTFTTDDLTLTDLQGNVESVAVENTSSVDTDYSMVINIADLKLILDSCKVDHITVNCGNHRQVMLARGLVNNFIPELRKA